MENKEEKSNQENENLKLSQLVLQQKREKLNLQKKVTQLEQQNKILNQQVEAFKIEKEEQDLEIKQLKEYVAKQEAVTTKLNGLIKKLLQRDEDNQVTHTQHDYSLSAPKTDAKSNKYSSQDIQEKRKKEQQYLEEQQKLDLQEQIVQTYKKRSLRDNQHPTTNKLPRIDDNNNKPIIVQVPKSQLKKINPHNIFEQLQKE